MAIFHIAYTEQINPAGSSPELTRAQIWKGLQRKIRRAQDFVPVIESCDVLEDSDNVVVRVAHFKNEDGIGTKAHTVREVCKSYPPVKVDFHQPNGALITNTVSDGPGMTEKDLNMTYTFEWRREDITEGSEEAAKVAKEYLKSAQMAVHSSIEAMRRMAKAGELD